MEVIKIEREAFMLDQIEKNKLLACLRYCKHRSLKHFKNNAGDIKFIEYMVLHLEKETELNGRL